MSEQINLRIPTGLLEEIDAMADAVGESRSAFLRTAAAERMGYLRCERNDESSAVAGGYSALQWQEQRPPDGSFFYVKHDRMSPTMAMRLGDEVVLFGESVVQGGRPFSDMPDSTQYWGPLPEPQTEATSAE